MNRSSQGFGLIELMIALVLGLVIVAGISQIFVSAKNTYASQSAAAGMQEDARFILSKMLQEIRMVGMFGCLTTSAIVDGSSPANFATNAATPISWNNASKSLVLVTADIGTGGGVPTWTITSDCRTSATAYTGAAVAATGQQAFPIRKLTYTYSGSQLLLLTGTGAGSGAALVNNVAAFDVKFGVAASATDTAVFSYDSNPSNPATIRSVRLSITLSDPNSRVRNQTFTAVAALRNRLQ
ncbi:PilW family protein [Pseudomonas vanderleydeniana]|uniref:Prepilin-type N-terminal cleavage/methylation domain-containing protein n=1 Tax=Pseudomonas vanderleydeniana TaxID=2745495 RepID=A0A9E6TTK8_9PSED|nr:prepilin-type N-terminal cleavage/methylation domain-containing protein [Pseudomonas vanderleydeniana]QXI29370.1 prepilin-type N-terminal cleavage/methylation domain-containing protein [Pseudomonas vanderleydeniana]